VEVKDVSLPNDPRRLRRCLKAKQEARRLERARGEARLRNLANAARVLEGNPADELRLMQSLVTAQQAGSTLVVGMPAALCAQAIDQAAGAENTERLEQRAGGISPHFFKNQIHKQ